MQLPADLEETLAKRVLVVEDERDVADLVVDVLDLEGYESRIASGETALVEAVEFRPNVVLLDLMMPGIDGFEVARQLHARDDTRSLPIVVMTAMHDAPGRAREVGAQGVIAKPFDIVELIRVVQSVTG
jgi:two-component system phosphate regulon response regulator PhoB